MKSKKITSGSNIGIVSPSHHFPKQKELQLKACEKILQELYGVKFVLSPNFTAVDAYGISGGTAEQRADDINGFFMRDDIDAIWCFQGGDTANEVLDYLDYDAIKNNPKIFTGLSDITVLLNTIYHKTGLITVHSTDPKAGLNHWHMESEYSQSEFSRVLIEGKTGGIPQIADRVSVKNGAAKGILIGGNLTCLLKLAGTQYAPDYTDKILMLEGFTVGGELSKILFNIAQLKQQANFDKLAGIIVGRYYGFDDETVLNLAGEKIYFEQMLKDALQGYDFPVIKCHEFGHRCPSTFLPVGGVVSFDTATGAISVEDEFLV